MWTTLQANGRHYTRSAAKYAQLILYFLLLLAPCHIVFACPAEVCICKWKGGKQTVECGGQQLPSIPEGMDPGTQVLNFSGNSLQVLQSERFLRMDLLNLQKIYLSRNQLIRIHEKAFRGLSNLVELDLSDNSLQHVPSETFQDYSSLMRLSLSGNPIRELKTSAFRHLSFLTTLELSNCQVERVENEAFVGMDNLEWLRLDGNRIGFIQGAHILPKSLHGISLQSNRWLCDCRLLDIHAWLVNYNTPQSEEPKCVEPPRLKGQVIKSLKKDELACLPEVSPKSSYTEISEGRNVSIVCVVRAIPEPKVLWLFNGQVMNNDSLVDNLHMYYYIDESGGSAEEKRSEIFIYNVGAEDNGTFSCVGRNIAGTTFSNYTLRVIIKEPPVVNEVSFPRDYMNYIIASSMGAAVIFVVLLCTIVVKCKQRQPTKRKKCGGGGGGGGAVTSVTGNTNSTEGSTNDAGLMKCSSIINDGDSMGGGGGGGLLMGDGMTPTKLCKENGLIIGGQMKQNLLLYAPAAHYQQQQQSGQGLGADGGGGLQSLQLNMSMGMANGTPPPLMVGPAMGGSIAYCSPPSSVRNYQEKNPDLVNDAESVNHKLKSAAGSLDNDYDAASDCSGPCSVQGMSTTPVQYDNCYQLAPQFGAQLMRPGAHANLTASSRFAAMTTLPRGMQLKSVMGNLSAGGGAGAAATAPQHQVDVHLNPVCFLGQDGFAYDYSNAHLQQPVAPPSHHHLHLQPQHSLGSAGPMSPGEHQHQHQLQHQQQQQQLQHHQQHHQQQQHQQQQHFYRTLPHNRAHKQQQFAASSAANPGMRYSLEAEFMQRAGTPPSSYDKYLPNVRFTAEGYPQPPQLVQYPSPPEGYKSSSSPAPGVGTPASHESAGGGSASTISTASFQQWPPCLPGYHVQPIRYPPTIVGVLSAPTHQPLQPQQTPQQQQQQQQQQLQQQQQKPTQTPAQPLTSTNQTQTQTQTPTQSPGSKNVAATATANASNAASTSNEAKKRCAAAQADASTIPECDENDISPNVAGSVVKTAAAAASASASASTSTDSATSTTSAGGSTEETSKLRHLNGPLADSPDEGYVGDSHEGSDI